MVLVVMSLKLHGNMFIERCESCNYELVRSLDVGGIGFK